MNSQDQWRLYAGFRFCSLALSAALAALEVKTRQDDVGIERFDGVRRHLLAGVAEGQNMLPLLQHYAQTIIASRPAEPKACSTGERVTGCPFDRACTVHTGQ